MSDNISLVGLDKALVLKALYDRAKTQGMGVLHYTPEPMEVGEAEKLMKETKPIHYFDYVYGRVLKVYLDKDELDPRLYDRDNGAGAAAIAVAAVRNGLE